MNEKFFDLAREKQDRMINGAVEVFARNGYKHASTDEMVKATGISKGLWFHYFGSKEGLYVFVYDYCVRYILLELSTAVDGTESDYFELVKKVSAVKIKAGRNYPYLTLFLEKAVYETEQKVITKTAESRRSYQEKTDALLGTAEIENVADKAKRECIKKMLEYTINSIIRERIMQETDFDEALGEIKAYIDLVKDMTHNLP